MPDSSAAQQRKHNERHILTMVRWLLILVFVVIGYWILAYVGPILTPLIVAAGIAYLLDPVVDRLEQRGMKRVWAVSLLLVAFLSITTTLIIVMAPLVVDQGRAFVEDLPDMLERAAEWVATTFGFEIPTDWMEYFQGENLEKIADRMTGPATEIVGAVLGGVFSLLGFLAELLLIPVFAFYFMLDWDRIVERVRNMLPHRHRASIVGLVRECDQVVSAWIRGQLMVTTVLAILYAIAFVLCGVHLAIPIGLLVGFLTFIPFLGTIVGAIITAVLLLLDWQGPGQIAAVGGVFVVLHLLEAAVLTPKLVGKKVGLGEVGALFAVVAGGKLLGLVGVLLAVPIAAAVAVLVRHAFRYYERSDLFATKEERVGLLQAALADEAYELFGEAGGEAGDRAEDRDEADVPDQDEDEDEDEDEEQDEDQDEDRDPER